MKFEVRPIGKQYRFDQVSDITDVLYTRGGLRITVIAATSMFTNIYLDIHFDWIDGFRALDEGDLVRYWESNAFRSGHHIYEILAGGWSNGETISDGLFTIHPAGESREWFIVTTNLCMNVLSGHEPFLREFTNPSISS